MFWFGLSCARVPALSLIVASLDDIYLCVSSPPDDSCLLFSHACYFNSIYSLARPLPRPGDTIIPHNYTLYDFAVNKTRGVGNNVLFSFADADADLRLIQSQQDAATATADDDDAEDESLVLPVEDVNREDVSPA